MRFGKTGTGLLSRGMAVCLARTGRSPLVLLVVCLEAGLDASLMQVKWWGVTTPRHQRRRLSEGASRAREGCADCRGSTACGGRRHKGNKWVSRNSQLNELDLENSINLRASL
ncbi:hypothetical protein NL676_038511 [Syzygium grande]|nr:hypothetical protein NL676_038511 [Syzygium grande]